LQAGTIIVGDATTSTDEIAAFFQVDSSAFTSMSYNLPLAPVKRFRITGAGAFNTIRSNAEKMNADRLRKSLPAYLNLSESEIGYIDYKKFSDSKDLTHFSTGRGSNAFKDKKALVVFGNPLANLGAIACHYEALYGMRLGGNLKDPGFQAYYSMKIREELIQEEGRLRANRRANESLSIYFVTDREVQFEGLSDILFHEITATASSTKNGKQQAREAIAKELLAKGTLNVLNLAVEAGISESAMRRYISTNYGSLEAFTASIMESIKELEISETQVVELVPTIAMMATNQYTQEDIAREFKDYCKRFLAFPKNKFEKALTFETPLS
jgi:predicted transcriptional regulator